MKDFNSKEWIENTDLRYRMSNNLKDEVLVGKTKTEVLKLLGEHDGECGYKKSLNTICYLIPDPNNLGLLDHYELVIIFNAFGRVERVTVELI